MKRLFAVLVVGSAALIMPTSSLAGLVGNPHIHVTADSLGGGFIQYTINAHQPLLAPVDPMDPGGPMTHGAMAVEMTATGNFSQFDTDGVTVIIPPIGEVELLPPGEVNFEDEATIADGDPTYAGGGGSTHDSWWDRSILSTPNPPFGGAAGGAVGSMAYSFAAGSPAGSDISEALVGQLVIFDAAAIFPPGPLTVGSSGLAPFSLVDTPGTEPPQPSLVAAQGDVFPVNGTFAITDEPPMNGNLPPEAVGAPFGIIDINAHLGHSLSESFSFLDPDSGDTVSVMLVDTDDAQGDGLMFTPTNGVNPALADLDWTPSANLMGNSYNLLFEFEDNLMLAGMSQPLTLNVIPEPSSVTLAGMGLIGLMAYGWRRRRR